MNPWRNTKEATGWTRVRVRELRVDREVTMLPQMGSMLFEAVSLSHRAHITWQCPSEDEVRHCGRNPCKLPAVWAEAVMLSGHWHLSPVALVKEQQSSSLSVGLPEMSGKSDSNISSCVFLAVHSLALVTCSSAPDHMQ